MEEKLKSSNIDNLLISMGGKLITTEKMNEGTTTQISQGEGGNSTKKKTRNKKIGTPKAKKTSNLEGKKIFFEKFMRTGGNSNTYGGTIFNPVINPNPQEFQNFRGEPASQSGGGLETRPRQRDSELRREGGDWPERRAMGANERMGEQIASEGGGE
jgi:hypothetical protein